MQFLRNHSGFGWHLSSLTTSYLTGICWLVQLLTLCQLKSKGCAWFTGNKIHYTNLNLYRREPRSERWCKGRSSSSWSPVCHHEQRDHWLPSWCRCSLLYLAPCWAVRVFEQLTNCVAGYRLFSFALLLLWKKLGREQRPYALCYSASMANSVYLSPSHLVFCCDSKLICC